MNGASRRLRYAPFTPGDAADLFPVLGDPRVHEHFPDPPAASAVELAEQFAARAAGPRAGHDVVVRLADGTAVGCVGATRVGDRAEVAYLFGPAFWGRGYAGEALAWLEVELAVRGVRTLWAAVGPANARSRRVSERAGYRQVAPDPAVPLLSYDPGDLVFTKSAPAARRVELDSPAATDDLGRRIGESLFPGAVVALTGDLGAGKTHLCRAICAGLGVKNLAAVNSPTFVLIQEYRGRLPVYHFDTYRLTSPREFLELGADEYLQGDGVCLIEWADRVAEHLPAERLTLALAHAGPERRTLTATAGGRYEAVLGCVPASGGR